MVIVKLELSFEICMSIILPKLQVPAFHKESNSAFNVVLMITRSTGYIRIYYSTGQVTCVHVFMKGKEQKPGRCHSNTVPIFCSIYCWKGFLEMMRPRIRTSVLWMQILSGTMSECGKLVYVRCYSQSLIRTPVKLTYRTVFQVNTVTTVSASRFWGFCKMVVPCIEWYALVLILYNHALKVLLIS